MLERGLGNKCARRYSQLLAIQFSRLQAQGELVEWLKRFRYEELKKFFTQDYILNSVVFGRCDRRGFITKIPSRN